MEKVFPNHVPHKQHEIPYTSWQLQLQPPEHSPTSLTQAHLCVRKIWNIPKITMETNLPSIVTYLCKKVQPAASYTNSNTTVQKQHPYTGVSSVQKPDLKRMGEGWTVAGEDSRMGTGEQACGRGDWCLQLGWSWSSICAGAERNVGEGTVLTMVSNF